MGSIGRWEALKLDGERATKACLLCDTPSSEAYLRGVSVREMSAAASCWVDVVVEHWVGDSDGDQTR